MAEAWVYIDESQGPAADAVDPGKPFRVGALVLEAPVPLQVPSDGLAILRADKDSKSNKYDQATLARGYFHASIDSANAHSALTNAIKKAAIGGTFTDSQ
ncbi:MAG: hypothetical protein QM723_27535 [Myxococcaceae bacterium]